MKSWRLIFCLALLTLGSCERENEFQTGPCQGLSPNVTLRADGIAIFADVAGGAAPFKYQWSTGDTVANLQLQPSGYYELYLIDANGCTGEADIEYINPCDDSTLRAWIAGGVNSASLQIFGGQAPYDIQWSNGGTALSLSDLPVGYLSAVVTDSEGCAVHTETLIGVGCEGQTELMDIDGNVYQVVEIGGQCWTASNLRTLRYDNGAAIELQQSPSFWGPVSSGLCAEHPDNVDAMLPYGILYNWFATVDPRGLCPAGWHVPSDLEWLVLESTAGGPPFAGAALKAVEGWQAPNAGAADQYGFKALPAGRLNVFDGYELEGEEAHFWSSSRQGVSNSAYQISLSYELEGTNRGLATVNRGHSVRCVKD